MCAVRYASVHGASSDIPQPVPPARCWLASSGCWPAAMYASPGPSGARPLVGCLEGHPKRLCAVVDEGVPHAHLTRLPAHSWPIHALIVALSHARLSAHSALAGRQVRTQTGPVGAAAGSRPWAVRPARQTVAAAQGVAVGSRFARLQIAPVGADSTAVCARVRRPTSAVTRGPDRSGPMIWCNWVIMGAMRASESRPVSVCDSPPGACYSRRKFKHYFTFKCA